jgi:hypothetical protein
MSLEVGKIVSELGDALIAKVGEEVGLDGDLAVRAAHALAAHIGSGRDAAVKQAAAETGVGEEVIAALLSKLIEAGAQKLMEESPVGDAMASAKAAAEGAIGKAAGGMLGKLFGRG